MEQIINQIQLDTLKVKNIIFVLLILIVFDITTGIINAVLNKEVDSTKMKNGITGKVYEIGICAICLLFDKLFNIDVICRGACLFYIAQEFASILENTGTKISYPDFLKGILKKLNNNKGENNNEHNN